MKKALALLLVLALLAGRPGPLLAKDGEDDDTSPSPTASSSPAASSSPSASSSPAATPSPDVSSAPAASASASPAVMDSPAPSSGPGASATPDVAMQTLEDRIRSGHEDWAGRHALLRELVALRVLRGDLATTVVVNGTVLRFDVPPLLRENRLMVPVRAVTTAFGADVDWRPLLPDIVTISRSVTLADGSVRLVRIVINLRTGIVTKNGTVMVLDAKPTVVSGRTMVPLRFIAEAFGKYVDYDKVSKGVFIDDNFPPGVLPPAETAGASPSPSSPPAAPTASATASPAPSATQSPTASPISSPSPSPSP